MGDVGGVSYGAFIIPGLIMLSLLNESISNASFGIYMPKWAGTIYELLSAPVSYVEVVLGYVGAAATKSVILGLLILVTARLFVAYEIQHPFWMVAFLLLTAVTFSLFGFIIGLWADDFQKLQVVPLMVITPLTFLGGSFYSISMLPPVWQKITLFNPVVYLVNGFRWSFYGKADVDVVVSVGMTVGFLLVCLARGLVDLPHGLETEVVTAEPRNPSRFSGVPAKAGSHGGFRGLKPCRRKSALPSTTPTPRRIA